MTHDHRHDGGYHAANVLRELTAAIERRGIQDASADEVFILQKRDGDGEDWLHERASHRYDDVIQPAFVKAVQERPHLGWRVVVRHTITVTTMLFEHNPGTRG